MSTTWSKGYESALMDAVRMSRMKATAMVESEKSGESRNGQGVKELDKLATSRRKKHYLASR